MSFLFFLLFLVLIFGVFILLIVVGFIRNIFNFGRKMNPFSNQKQEQQSSGSHFNQPESKKKIIEKSEGEYVDYEEMKE